MLIEWKLLIWIASKWNSIKIHVQLVGSLDAFFLHLTIGWPSPVEHLQLVDLTKFFAVAVDLVSEDFPFLPRSVSLEKDRKFADFYASGEVIGK